jgi:hypothetical protein
MANSTLIQQQFINKLYTSSEDKASQFTEKQKILNLLNEAKSRKMQNIDNNYSAFWSVMFSFAILAAVGFGIFEMFMAQTTIAAIIDPTNKGVIPSPVIAFIGFTIAIIGMLIGHELTENININEVTGEKHINMRFWIFFVCAVFYVIFQFSLVMLADAGIKNSSFKYLPYVVLCISILEIIIGAFILSKAFNYSSLMSTNIKINSTNRKIRLFARSTNINYRNYIRSLEHYNSNNPNNRIEQEGNQNIRAAIRYYLGEVNNDVNTQQNTNQNDGNILYNNSQPNTNIQNNQGNNDINNFLDDTIDENVTV